MNKTKKSKKNSFKKFWNKIVLKTKNYFLPKGIELDMLRYRPNKLSYTFALWSIILLVVGFCVTYSNTSVLTNTNFSLFGITNVGLWFMFDILINIVLMLFLFLASVKMRAYSKSHGIFAICYGVFSIVRPFILPLALLRSGIMSSLIYSLVTAFYIASGFFSIVAGFLAIYRGASLRAYLETVKPIENERVEK